MIMLLTNITALLLATTVVQPPANAAQPVTPTSIAAVNASLRASGKSKAAVPVTKSAAAKRSTAKAGAPTAAAKPAAGSTVVGLPAMKHIKKPARQ